MKTLRAKLFLSVGVILLIVAAMNYFLPEIFIKKDINKASVYMNQRFTEAQKKLAHLSSFLISLRLVESGVELKALSEVIEESYPKQKDKSWVAAAEIAGYSSQLAFVQINDPVGGNSVVIPKDGELYTPLWAPFEEGMLWIKIPEKGKFVAIPVSNSYLLFNLSDSAAPGIFQEKFAFAAEHIGEFEKGSFTAFDKSTEITLGTETINQLYDFMLRKQEQWIEKREMIQELAPWYEGKGSPAGLLRKDQTKGVCILSDEVFSTSLIIKKSVQNEPFLVLRENGDLDIASIFSVSKGGTIGMGFSISTIVKQIAQLIQKPIILSMDNASQIFLGFTAEGKSFDPSLAGISLSALSENKELIFQGAGYIPYQIPIDQLRLTILDPVQETLSLMHYLTGLRDDLISKISLILLAAALLSLGVALFLLGRTSERITHPIAMLAKASEEIGEGKYEGLHLPNVEKRDDEVAILSHAFEGMVVSLRDREKVRGMLNKVVSKEVAEEILKSDIELIGEERVATMLFSDIRGFTHFSENRQPSALIALLNEYMTRMCRIIDTTKGVVDKFVGDEIMALYGVPLLLENHALYAIDAALKMIQDLRIWNAERSKKGEATFEIGIGIHTGLVFSGNIGAENRLNYTVIGANVNLASRLCANAKPMQIVVSEATWKIPGVQESFRFQEIGPVSLKGIEHPVIAYEVIEKIQR